MRKQEPPRTLPSETSTQPKEPVKRLWSARYAVRLLLKRPETLEPDKRAALERVLDASAVLRRAYNFTQAFIRIVHPRLSKALQPWLNAVTENKIPELAGFAHSLKQDQNAVFAAPSLPWSN